METQKFDVIGFGALNLDRLYKVRCLAKPGEHQDITGFEESPGGSAANTLAGLARLGLRTGFIGGLGRDNEAEVILDDFKDYHVDTCGIIQTPDRTGFIIGLVEESGERTLYPYPGANNLLFFDPMMLDYAKTARYLHLSSFVGEKQFDAQEELVKKLPEHVKISFSPGIIYVRKGFQRLKPIISRSDIVFLNETETLQLTGEHYIEGGHKLIDKGAKTVVVTLGKEGSWVLEGETETKAEAYNSQVVDTTGAGDSFAAGFLFGKINEMSSHRSASIGNLCASQCIQKMGARKGLPGREALEEYLHRI